MKSFLQSAVIAGVLGAVGIGAAGVAAAAPIHDPNGLCTYHDDKGNCQVAASGPSVDIDMVFPADVPQEQAIVDYLTTVQNDFSADEQTGTLDDPAPQQALDVTSAGYTSAATRTVVLDVYRNSGGAHPMTWYKAFPISTATNAPITFDQLFRPGSAPLETIMPIVARQLSDQAGTPVTLDPKVGLDPANYQEFALTDDAVVFFFGNDQLQPATGSFEVSVPRSAVAAMLRPGL